MALANYYSCARVVKTSISAGASVFSCIAACRAMVTTYTVLFFFSSRRRHTRFDCDWSSDVCSSDLDAKRARHLSRGDEYFGQGRYKDALIEYQNVLRFNASDSRAIERMGFAYHNLGDFRRAYPFLLKARQANPDDVNVTMKLAAIYLLAGKLDEARELAGGILEKDPNHLEALQVMAVAARRQNEIAEAAAGFEAARPVLEARAGYHLSLAELSVKKRAFGKAEGELKDALERDTKSVQAHLMLANVYRAKGDRDAALRELKTAVAVEPVAGGARLHLVDFYAGSNDYAKAKEV